MNKIFIAAVLAISTASVAQAQNIVGDWQGTLRAGDADLLLVLHVTKGDDGKLKATLDSLDQGANGIPVTTISLTDSKLSLTVDAVKGTYEGKVNPGATAIDGTWSQGQPAPLNFTRGISPNKTHKPAKPSDIDGAWMGTIDAGAMKLRVVFNISNTEDGLMATMDSLDQHAKGIPVTSVTRAGALIKMEVKGIGGTFQGSLDKDLLVIDGTWSQGGGAAPLVLKRVKDQAELVTVILPVIPHESSRLSHDFIAPLLTNRGATPLAERHGQAGRDTQDRSH